MVHPVGYLVEHGDEAKSIQNVGECYVTLSTTGFYYPESTVRQPPAPPPFVAMLPHVKISSIPYRASHTPKTAHLDEGVQAGI